MIGLAMRTVVKDEVARARRADHDLLQVPVRMMAAHDIRFRAPDVIDALDLKREVCALLKRDQRPRLVAVNRKREKLTYHAFRFPQIHFCKRLCSVSSSTNLLRMGI